MEKAVSKKRLLTTTIIKTTTIKYFYESLEKAFLKL